MVRNGSQISYLTNSLEFESNISSAMDDDPFSRLCPLIPMNILVLNAGSSSHKAALFDLANTPMPLWQAHLDWTHRPGLVELTAQTADGRHHQGTLETQDKTTGLGWMLDSLVTGPVAVLETLEAIQAVGHRVVHGGRSHQHSVRITPAVKAAIQAACPLAPAHNPANLAGIEACEVLLGTIPQVAVFDTAFHAHMPAAAIAYPGPYDWLAAGIQRYGFHGISHRYVAQRAAALLGQDLQTLRLITCHLGNGCSLAAIREGVSVDTTMGFTPLDGMMMGSRCGALDPGILVYLLRQDGLTADDLDHVLNKQSGLLGISGESNDLRQVLAAAEQGSDRAQLAVEMFIHSLRRNIGAMLASLGSLDALVFTAGIGENSALIWQRACQDWASLGLALDPDKLQRQEEDRDIAAATSAVRVLVIHTREEWAIAHDCYSVLTDSA